MEFQTSHPGKPQRCAGWLLALPRTFAAIAYTAPGLGGVGRGLGVARGLGVGVGLGVAVGLAVAVAVGVDVGVAVAVAVGVTVAVAVAVAAGVGVGVPPGTRKA